MANPAYYLEKLLAFQLTKDDKPGPVLLPDSRQGPSGIPLVLPSSAVPLMFLPPV